MDRIAWLKVGLLSCGLLFGATAAAAETLRVGGQVLVVGESAVRTIDMLGEPAYKEPVETARGGYVGERWQYRLSGRIVTVTIIGGKVAEISDRDR